MFPWADFDDVAYIYIPASIAARGDRVHEY